MVNAKYAEYPTLWQWVFPSMKATVGQIVEPWSAVERVYDTKASRATIHDLRRTLYLMLT